MKNPKLGSIFIVAGTTIGAGMLAIPIAVAENGYFVSLLLLISLWAIMCYSALLLVEVYQNLSPTSGFSSLAKYYLGRPGQYIANFSMLFLSYALVAAYISGAGEIIQSSLEHYLNLKLSDSLSIVVFTLFGGALICFGTASVDFINRCLFLFKILFFILLLILMFGYLESENFLSRAKQPILIISALPIIFTSFGFHGSVPSVIKYMNGQHQKLPFIFICGSLLPLIAYILWQTATLGTINSTQFSHILQEQSGLKGLLASIQQVTQSPLSIKAAHLFMSLALATSFFGVALGLFDFLADFLNKKEHLADRVQTGFITFSPPLVFALFYPKGFVIALGYAAIALAIMALILPSLSAYKARQMHPDKPRTKGGSLALLFIFLFGISIIAIQLAISFNLLPRIS